MNQIIVISPDEKFRTRIESECSRYPDAFPVFYESLSEIVDLLEVISVLDTVVIGCTHDERIEQDFQIMRKRKEKFINAVVYCDENDCGNYPCPRIRTWEELCTFLGHRLGRKEEDISRYISIPLQTLIHFEVLPFPLYLNLSVDNFVKRFPAFEKIDLREVEKYCNRGVKEFYFERNFSRDFTNLLMNNMLNRLEREYRNDSDREVVTSEVYGTVKDIIASIGLRPRVINLCETLMEQVNQSVQEEAREGMMNYLEKLRTRPELNFHFRLTRLTSFIAAQILPAWRKEDLKDLIFAAFFCDMTLRKAEHVHYRAGKELFLLPEEERAEVSVHASFAAALALQSKLSSGKGPLIIRQHHGDPDGNEIPDKVHEDIDELTKYFIVSHELAYMLLIQPQARIWKIAQDLLERHRGTVLEEIFVAFEVNLLSREKVA